MSSTEIAMKTTNTTLSPYTFVGEKTSPKDASKRSSDVISDDQYWRYDVSQKRRKHEAGDGERICFKFVSSGSCPRGEKCNFRHDMDAREQYMRGVCFDFLNKGRCERGPDCNFKHSLQDEGDKHPSRRPGSENTRSYSSSFICVYLIRRCSLRFLGFLALTHISYNTTADQKNVGFACQAPTWSLI